MNLDRVKYKNNRPYIERYEKNNLRKKTYLRKVYGKIIKCANQSCGMDCFGTNYQILKGNRHYCSLKCKTTLENHPNWKNGVRIENGYITIKNNLHPHSVSRGYVREHRLIIEKVIGRYLHTVEVVHHINKIKTDNRLENLMVFDNHSSHKTYEQGGDIPPESIIFDGRNYANY